VSKKPICVGLLSDSPDAPSGLARITRDLASRLYTSGLPIRIATFGFQGVGSKDFPWTQYNLGPFNTSTDILSLIPAWSDFCRDEKGILLTIYDLQRLEAFAFPQLYGQAWLQFCAQPNAPELWGYFPIDAHTPDGSMTQQSAEILRGFDRILAYGPYGQGVLNSALWKLKDGRVPAAPEWLPHGYDPHVFVPHDGRDGRAGMVGGGSGRDMLRREIATSLTNPDGKLQMRTLDVSPSDKLLGVVATNQGRKDWGSVFKVLAELPPNWKLWAHTDRLVHVWSIPDLAQQYGVTDRVFVTQGLGDEELASLYRACDVTFAPGLGEGFGFPILESRACGTPCLHFDYAGGADLTPWKLEIEALRTEGAYCLQRPILTPRDISRIADWLQWPESIDAKKVDPSELIPYAWPQLWPKWKTWFRQGLEAFKAKI
jgi:glycosyltransferase involved in cell wall biosynthesis